LTTNLDKNKHVRELLLPAWAVAVGLGAVVISIALTLWLLSIAGRNPTLRIEAIQIGLTLGAGVSGSIAIVLAFRRQWLSERAQVHAEDDATQRRITELYARAVEELGHDKAPVRLGGMYALERLAQDQSVQRQTVVDVICAYLRMPFDVPGPITGMTRTGPDEASAIKSEGVPRSGDRQELQVRRTAQILLESHLTVPDGNNVGISEENYWPGMRIDLSGATLIDFGFYRCHAHYANFRDTYFAGNAQFEGAQFSEGVRFDGARFSGTANFNEARFDIGERFTAASFEGAIFCGDTQFNRARFTNSAVFYKAHFCADAAFLRTQFDESASFNEAQFDGIALFDSEFSGDAAFQDAMFIGGAAFGGVTFADTAGFEGAWFIGPAEFSKAEFRGDAYFGAGTSVRKGNRSEGALFAGTVSFAAVRFAGRALFDGVQFADEVSFEGTRFSRTPSFKEARAYYGSQHFWPPGWRIETPSSSSEPIGRLIPDTEPPASPTPDVNG